MLVVLLHITHLFFELSVLWYYLRKEILFLPAFVCLSTSLRKML